MNSKDYRNWREQNLAEYQKAKKETLKVLRNTTINLKEVFLSIPNPGEVNKNYTHDEVIKLIKIDQTLGVKFVYHFWKGQRFLKE